MKSNVHSVCCHQGQWGSSLCRCFHWNSLSLSENRLRFLLNCSSGTHFWEVLLSKRHRQAMFSWCIKCVLQNKSFKLIFSQWDHSSTQLWTFNKKDWDEIQNTTAGKSSGLDESKLTSWAWHDGSSWWSTTSWRTLRDENAKWILKIVSDEREQITGWAKFYHVISWWWRRVCYL